MKKLMLICAGTAAPLLAGCPATVPVQAPTAACKTEVVNTACTTFALIKVPRSELAGLSDRLKTQITNHDDAYTAACGAPAAK